MPDSPDEVWLRETGARGWVVVTHDARIRYKPNELAAVIAHKVVMLVVGHAPYADLARSFVTTTPRILEFVAAHQPPFIAKVYRPQPSEVSRNPAASGRVELWYPKHE